MQVTNTTNQYQALQTQQQPITTPVEPKDPTYSNKDIYEASQGNLIRGEEGLELTTQGELNVNNTKDAKATETEQAAQAQKDAQRGTAVDYLAVSSKKSQAEIYLAVATDGNSDSSSNATADIISELRDVQKQNNAVQAYATYQDNQAQGQAALF
jgi:hypothetical protein